MNKYLIPELSEHEINEGLVLARASSRRRYPKILHKPGDEFNQVFNFIMRDSYMQPHMHPGSEKIEEISLVKGRVVVMYFDDSGNVVRTIELKNEGVDSVRVPAFTWHTYVMMTEEVITYETMMGEYDPNTWKKMASWSPKENSTLSKLYLNTLALKLIKHKGG